MINLMIRDYFSSIQYLIIILFQVFDYMNNIKLWNVELIQDSLSPEMFIIFTSQGLSACNTNGFYEE